MTSFGSLEQREANCRAITVADSGLKPLCKAVESELSSMQDVLPQLVKQGEVSAKSTSMLLFTWITAQLTSAFQNTLAGNYSASVSNLRSAFEGTVFLKAYSIDADADKAWSQDVDYESDKVMPLLRKTLRDSKQFDAYHEHYRNLSKMAHPYPKVRFLLSKASGEDLMISRGGYFQKDWAAILLVENLFIATETLTTVAPSLDNNSQIAIEKYKSDYSKLSKTLIKK